MTQASYAHPDETPRLAALQALGLLDTPPEAEFDAIARLAAKAVGGTDAFIALIDAERMWIKAGVGNLPPELPRRQTFCDTVVRTEAALVVEDAARDPRFWDLPVVRAGARFYAGLPIRVTDTDGARHLVGTLCAIDSVARALTKGEREALDELATLAEALIAARGLARDALAHATALERQQRVFRQAERMAEMGWWRLNIEDNAVEWSDGVFRIHDLEIGSYPTLEEGLEFYPPHARAVVSQSLAHAINTGEAFDFETDFVSSKGSKRRVRSTGEVEWTGERAAAIIGVIRDVTAEHALSVALRQSADSDPLTQIANRAAFTRMLDKAMDHACESQTALALVLIDLDGFKRINDTFGHPAGDEVLKAVATRLHAPWLAHCCAARLGGDEFGVIVDDPALLADDASFVARLESELQVSTCIDGLTLESGASIGMTRFDPERFPTQRAFIQAADARLYTAKRERVGDRRRAA